MAAVVVLHGQASDPAALLAGLAPLVGRTVLVDNNETPLPGLAQRLRPFAVDVLPNGNRGGLAGAYNQALRRLDEGPGPTPAHVVFVDQDSDTTALTSFITDPTVEALLAREDVACAAPVYRDRATGLRGRYIELARWRVHHLPREFDGARPVAFVINSMSVWRTAALARLGDFDETLGIDHVDTEHCLRARALGLGVWVHGGHAFAHAIGDRRRYRFLGRELQAGGHGPARRRLIGRNTVLLARRWAFREPAFAWLCLMRLVYESVGIVMAEDHRAAKLAALFGGMANGLFMRDPA
jgi:rhamnosyltransferase